MNAKAQFKQHPGRNAFRQRVSASVSWLRSQRRSSYPPLIGQFQSICCLASLLAMARTTRRPWQDLSPPTQSSNTSIVRALWGWDRAASAHTSGPGFWLARGQGKRSRQGRQQSLGNDPADRFTKQPGPTGSATGSRSVRPNKRKKSRRTKTPPSKTKEPSAEMEGHVGDHVGALCSTLTQNEAVGSRSFEDTPTNSHSHGWKEVGQAGPVSSSGPSAALEIRAGSFPHSDFAALDNLRRSTPNSARGYIGGHATCFLQSRSEWKIFCLFGRLSLNSLRNSVKESLS